MSQNQLFELLLNISSLSILLPVITALFFIRAFNVQLKALFLYIIVCVLAEIAAYIVVKLHFNTYLVFHVFTMLEGPIIFYIYYKELNFKRNNFVFLFAGIIVLFSGCLQFSDNSSNDITSSIEAILISVFAIVWFFKVFVDMTIPKLTDYYFFWINSGFLIYFLGPFFISIFESTIRESEAPILNALWIIHVAISLLFNIILTIGICKIKRK